MLWPADAFVFSLREVYEDTLLDADGCPVYIGEFVGDVPHGQGRLHAFLMMCPGGWVGIP